MKKSIFLMAGLVGLALTSCDDTSDLGVMQKNEAPVVIPADGVAIQSLYAAAGNKIDLQDYEESVFIPLIDIVLSADFPAESTVTGQVEIADNPDFTNAKTISLSSTAGDVQNPGLAAAVTGDTRSYQGYVEVTAWNEAFVSFYGLNPAADTNYLRYKLWLANGDQKVILYDNNGNEWWSAMEFTVTPLDAQLDVESAYTLSYIVNLEGDIYDIVMYHNPDKHVYDDPEFSATIEVPESTDGSTNTVYWWITAGEGGGGMPYGVVGDDPEVTSGSLALIDVGNPESPAQNGQISIPGTYKLTANMLEKTFMVQMAPNSLYVKYASGSFDQMSQLSTNDYVTYVGMAGLLGNFSLTGQDKFTPTLYVNDPDVAVTDDTKGTYTGGLAFSTGGATAATENAIPYGGSAGLFYITADLQTLKWTRYLCKTVGITGSIEGLNWGEGADIELKGSRTTQYMQWTGTVTVKAGDEWKIRANGEWAVNFGGANGGEFATDGTPVELSMDGANFVAAEDGTYNVTVNFKRQYVDGEMTPYTMTVTPVE